MVFLPQQEEQDGLEDLQLKTSKTRHEIEGMLRRIGLSLDSRINVVDLESGERFCFNSYPEALEFMKGKKGRWYITAPGIRYIPRQSSEEQDPSNPEIL